VRRVRGRVSSRWKSCRRCVFALGGAVRPGIGRPHRRSPRDRRAFALTRRANLQTPPRRADPSRLSPPPQAKRERLEQMRKMGIGKFQKVRQARVDH